MTGRLVQILFLTVCMISYLTPAGSTGPCNSSVIQGPLRQPISVFIAGPGTVLSVRFLDPRFMKPSYSVVFKTEDGELIQVWHSGKPISLVEGIARYVHLLQAPRWGPRLSNH
jgi:hypothetical protein